jgi:glucosamine--fructose-6-phosphate aminotransferase (isomerizing)
MSTPQFPKRFTSLSVKAAARVAGGWLRAACRLLTADLAVGRCPRGLSRRTVVFFPIRSSQLHCGLAGMVEIHHPPATAAAPATDAILEAVAQVDRNGLTGPAVDTDACLGGTECIGSLLAGVRRFKSRPHFITLFSEPARQAQLADAAGRLGEIIARESAALKQQAGKMAVDTADLVARRLQDLKDAQWCLAKEVLANIRQVAELTANLPPQPSPEAISRYQQINAVLNSIDRLEVRGRDSAGISLMCRLNRGDYDRFAALLEAERLTETFDRRRDPKILKNNGINVAATPPETVSVAFVYKVAAEIGSLGDNVIFLRWQIQNDPILGRLLPLALVNFSVSAHTRWASVGAITEANCHPVDNRSEGSRRAPKGIIHVCLNGDIDNFQQLKRQYEADVDRVPAEVTTDTKIIPLLIEKQLDDGHSVVDAFRLAVNRFEGSHAITMHTDLAPGKLFLAQRGSGQTIFVGLQEQGYMATSEVYGFVETTSRYLKLDGEKVVNGDDGDTQGQIFVLDQDSKGELDGIAACYYDGTPIPLGPADIKSTDITSRDIDRQDFPHYFLKEISEAPASVEKTLHNRWKISDDGLRTVVLDPRTFPDRLREAFVREQIRKVFFVGQGTAGVAALACAELMHRFVAHAGITASALKASELSGFKIGDDQSPTDMSDTLVVAISQSGTTTDTNRAVDMVKERGAHTLAIVNRRDSDLTFKTDGVVYTSSGRDVEMSVASTKAFYSQIVAGALLCLHMGAITGSQDRQAQDREVGLLLEIPNQMRSVLAMRKAIEASARRLSGGKTYWAAVGSGPNKASADEIRIKLSELCYKTISSDFVEDKKHIDLSSEPLIIVCAAGTRDTVVGDIIKDTAIFHAHKATPIVIADDGENRFAPYAADVFHVPAVDEHLAPILNTLVGHIWGYYAALAINEGSRLLFGFREKIQKDLDAFDRQGLTVYEALLEESFRERMLQFYRTFRQEKANGRLPLSSLLTADLILLFKYMAGRLPVADFDADFGLKGTALNMLNTLLDRLGRAINFMSRPVDAIKHQAKTVTVGTSRISERLEGLLFEQLTRHGLHLSQLTPSNVIVLKNLQAIVERIEGAIHYRVSGLSLVGEPTDATTIEIVKKEGVLKPIPSRVESDNRLKGTKRIIVRRGNVYIGKGRKDDRSIIVIPMAADTGSATDRFKHLLLLNISFKQQIPLAAKIKALGGKYEHIKNIVQENSINWQDTLLEKVPTHLLFGISAEKVGESIVSGVNGGAD